MAGMRTRRRPSVRSLVGVVLVVLATPVVSAGAALGALIFLPLPATLPQERVTFESNVTRLLDIEGNEIATFREFETRIPVAQDEIPQVLRDAVVAAEDRNFYSHGGVDIRGTLRALWTDLRTGEAAQGGSTITQQYVRQAYEGIGTERSLSRKIREAILASQLDRQMDKDEILWRYLDTIYFGEGAYGVGAAALTYFGKPVGALSLSEAALLVGVIPAPTAYSPRDHPDAAETKRTIVLDAMLDVGAITQQQHDDAVAEELWLYAFGPPPPGQPHTGVLPPEQPETDHPWFTDYVRSYLESHLPGCTPGDCPELTRGGLTVYTTMDPRAQVAAEEEVAELLEGTADTLETAIVAVEPPTGYVRALVGGRDFGLSQVNTALRERQPGSSFKPIVLAEAFEQGIRPEATYSGAPHEILGDVIGNYGGARYGTMNLRSATTNSVNTVFTRLIEDVGVEDTFDMANRLGVAMPAYDPARFGLSVALGAVETTPLEMASAYAVFANHGRRADPTPVYQVVRPDGSFALDHSTAAEDATQVVSAEVADNVTDVLRGVVTDGTAAGRGLPGRASAGKTGTAQENANAWFVGYTPTLSTAVWMGYRDCNCPLERIRGVRQVTGGSLPARTWQSFMSRALDGVPVTEFTEPAPIPDVRDEVERRERRGFDPGRRRSPSVALDGGDYVEGRSDPSAEAPEQTTTSTTPDGSDGSSTSTSTPGEETTTTPFTLLG